MFLNQKCQMQIGVLFVWVRLCHQEVLVVWRVFAWEDPISVLGVFVLHASLCPSTSESQHSSRQDLNNLGELKHLERSYLMKMKPEFLQPCRRWLSCQRVSFLFELDKYQNIM